MVPVRHLARAECPARVGCGTPVASREEVRSRADPTLTEALTSARVPGGNRTRAFAVRRCDWCRATRSAYGMALGGPSRQRRPPTRHRQPDVAQPFSRRLCNSCGRRNGFQPVRSIQSEQLSLGWRVTAAATAVAAAAAVAL